MKILQINKFYYIRGGAEQHFFDLIDLLRADGDTVIPFASAHPNNELTPFSRYFPSYVEWGRFSWKDILSVPRLIYSLEAKRKITALIRAERPDIAHAHLIYHHLSPSILVALKKARVPVALTIHDWKLLCPNYILYTEGAPCLRCQDRKYVHAARHRCIKGKLIPSLIVALEAYIHHARRYYEDYIDALIAPSNFVRDMFVSFGWPKEKITVLPHFLPATARRAEGPAPAPAAPVFGFLGRLAPEKGARELINYWLAHKIPYRLEIYGSGPLEHEVRALAAKAPRLISFGGSLSRSQAANKLRSLSGLIIPSLVYETFGLVALEALAAGVPVIAHRRGALSEIVAAARAGVMFDFDGEGFSLAEAIDQLLNSRAALANQAVRYLQAHHRADSYGAALKALYTSLLTRRDK